MEIWLARLAAAGVAAAVTCAVPVANAQDSSDAPPYPPRAGWSMPDSPGPLETDTLIAGVIHILPGGPMTPACRAAILSVLAGSTLILPSCSDPPAAPFSCTPGTPVVADYTDNGTFQAASVSELGTTVTGSNTVNVFNLNGLGIVGGAFDNAVDGAEWIRFDFDVSPVSEVSYFVSSAGNLDGDGTVGDATIEAFDRMGTSLGTRAVSGGGTIAVSTMFGDEPLSAFVVTAAVDNFRPATVTYSPCQ